MALTEKPEETPVTRKTGDSLARYGATMLPVDFETPAYRSTDATVFVVAEGTGHSTIDGHDFKWGAKDIFGAPSWKWISHHAGREAVLFSFSDRVAQQKHGLFREDRGNS